MGFMMRLENYCEHIWFFSKIYFVDLFLSFSVKIGVFRWGASIFFRVLVLTAVKAARAWIDRI